MLVQIMLMEIIRVPISFLFSRLMLGMLESMMRPLEFLLGMLGIMLLLLMLLATGDSF